MTTTRKQEGYKTMTMVFNLKMERNNPRTNMPLNRSTHLSSCFINTLIQQPKYLVKQIFVTKNSNFDNTTINIHLFSY